MQISLNVDELVNRWHRQIGRRRPYRHQRPLAALGFLRRSNEKAETLVELQRLLAVVLFDESIGRPVPALRLVGYGACQLPDGVQWGGPEQSKFYKDLRLAPEPGAWSLQLDATNIDLLHLALQLHSDIHRVDRFAPKSASLQPKLPRLWAGFSPSDAVCLKGQGPEFAELCAKFKLAPEAMLEKFRREHRGLVCLPLDWVSNQLAGSLSVFADVSETPRTQVFRLMEFPGSLQGFQGAAAFDFFNSPQREQFTVRLQRLQRKRAVQAIHCNRELPGRVEDEKSTNASHAETCGESC